MKVFLKNIAIKPSGLRCLKVPLSLCVVELYLLEDFFTTVRIEKLCESEPI